MKEKAIKMLEAGWKFVHAVDDDNGVSAETDRAGAAFRIALAELETALEKITGKSIETIKQGDRSL